MSGKWWGEKAVGLGDTDKGAERLSRVAQALKGVIPQGVRDAGRQAISGYAEKMRSAPLQNASLDAASHRAEDAIGGVANGAARAAGQPVDPWLEHHQQQADYWKAKDAEPAPVVQMKEVDVESDAPVAPVHHDERLGLSTTQMKELAALPPQKPQPHDKPMTHEQLSAKAQELLAERQAQLAALQAQPPAPAVGERDDSGRPLPEWLTTEMRRQ
jgi:hypothetical protein